MEVRYIGGGSGRDAARQFESISIVRSEGISLPVGSRSGDPQKERERWAGCSTRRKQLFQSRWVYITWIFLQTSKQVQKKGNSRMPMRQAMMIRGILESPFILHHNTDTDRDERPCKHHSISRCKAMLKVDAYRLCMARG
jgi:hypothetical protein